MVGVAVKGIFQTMKDDGAELVGRSVGAWDDCVLMITHRDSHTVRALMRSIAPVYRTRSGHFARIVPLAAIPETQQPIMREGHATIVMLTAQDGCAATQVPLPVRGQG